MDALLIAPASHEKNVINQLALPRFGHTLLQLFHNYGLGFGRIFAGDRLNLSQSAQLILLGGVIPTDNSYHEGSGLNGLFGYPNLFLHHRWEGFAPDDISLAITPSNHFTPYQSHRVQKDTGHGSNSR